MRAMRNGMPLSRVSSRASSSPFASISSARRSSSRARHAGVELLHGGDSNAVRAAATAASTSSASPAAARANALPVAGSITSNEAPEAAGRQRPAISSSRGCWVNARTRAVVSSDISWAFMRLSLLAPDVARDPNHQFELAPLLLLGDRVAVMRARESALRRQAQAVQRQEPGRGIDAPLDFVLVLDGTLLRRHQAEHRLFSGGQVAQRLERAGTRGIEFHEESVDIGRKHGFRHALVAALGNPGALEVAAAGVHRDRHARGAVAQRRIDDVRVDAGQRVRIIAVATAALAKIRIAQIGERDVVELQVSAAAIRQKADGVL